MECTGRSPRPPRSSRRSPARGRRSRSSRSTSAGSSTCRTSVRCAPRSCERTGLGEAELLDSDVAHPCGRKHELPARGQARNRADRSPYLEHLAAQVGDAVLEARSTAAEAFVTYGYGRCGLAANRDLWDASAERFACGYNPEGAADDTLLVARATDREGRTLATLFNYACHPTTLAWDEPSSLARLHRRCARGARGGIRRAGALPAGCLGRARATRRLRRRRCRRRPERPPARPRCGGRDRGAPSSRDPLRLHRNRRVGREPRHVGVPALRARAAHFRRAASRPC